MLEKLDNEAYRIENGTFVVQGKDRREKSAHLRSLLGDFGIDTTRWWSPQPGKGIEGLLDELENGEARLMLDGSQLVREVYSVFTEVFYMDEKGVTWVLVEDEILWYGELEEKIKSEDSRRETLGVSFAEKARFFKQEPLNRAAQRGAKEELGLSIALDRIHSWKLPPEMYQGQGPYRGLGQRFQRYPFFILLTAEEFKPEGYVEHNKDLRRKTFFRWKAVEPGHEVPSFSLYPPRTKGNVSHGNTTTARQIRGSLFRGS